MTLTTAAFDACLPVGDSAASPWLLSALVHMQVGIVVLDDAERVVFVNDWFVRRCGVPAEQLTGRPLTDVFPNIIGSYLQARLQVSRKTGFPAMLSHSLHAPQLPLYMPHLVGHPAAILSQTVHIIPMGRKASREVGHGYTLLQVTDVTPTVRRESLLKTRVDEMHLMARVDALTGIGNRREFDETLESEVRASMRSQATLGMLLIDIDHFKAYNDRYGHPAGDKCLCQVAHVLQRVVRRPRDKVARYGGEELVVLLPGTPLKGVLEVGQDVLESVRDLALPHEGNKAAEMVTVSVGAATLLATSSADGAKLVRMADEALYAAKTSGRNRMCHPLADEPEAMDPER
jgi:diguanylate cyclase (GGDEF)-like protein